MQIHGFILEKETFVEELDGRARLWKHAKTGASLLSFCNSDENKVFGVSFRTPPADSTGVAHILEHSVLCGSEKYPVKEPFVELLKGSLQTFLNAFTYPDKTCYPVASANLKDFRNLTDVYLDAVFFPRITEDIFRQEGWHLEPESGNDRLIYKGVVYNEMKGAFSSPESVLSRYSLHSLFPDTVYSLESGGDPEDIPSLTYENFIAFHKTYYHPSNARFFFWGDDEENERLEQLGAVLDAFESLTPQSSIGVQKPFGEPKKASIPFAASEDEKGMVVVNWLGPDVMDVETGLAFRMLEHILLGMPASPLRRALIESGLGEDLAGQGLETELRQLTFDVGLKGVVVEDAAKVENLILECLGGLAREGLPEAAVEAAVNSVEFALRENNSGRFPVGLSVMLRSLTTWLHDGDPLASLRFEEPLKNIKSKIAAGGRYFESLLGRWLVDNPHRVTVILTPDTGLAERQERKEREALDALSASMDASARKLVEQQAEVLEQWQATPDTPEALATIPRLKVEDLPRENSQIPTERMDSILPSWLFHPLPTGGIVYVEAGFELSAVPEYLLPLLPLFGRALLEMGTENRDFVDLNMTIARKTGGMDVDTLFLSHVVERKPVARLILSGKASPDKVADMFGLMREVLVEVSLDGKERFARMVLEEKARREHGLVPAGHMVVATRMRAALSGAGMLAEVTSGVSYLEYLRRLAERVEAEWEAVLLDLEVLRRTVLHRAGLILNITATPEQRDRIEPLCAELSEALPEQTVDGASVWQPSLADLPQNEALILPAQVNYVGKAINLFDSGYTWHGSAAVILKYLRTGYLWENVRVRGGAYGCMCGLDRMNGSFFMVSYRDPNVLPTLSVYDEAARHLATHAFSAEELNASIVGAIGELDSYLLPDAKGSAAFARILCGDTVDLRQQLREEILETTVSHCREFGQALEAYREHGRICALGGASLERTAREKGWHAEKVL